MKSPIVKIDMMVCVTVLVLENYLTVVDNFLHFGFSL